MERKELKCVGVGIIGLGFMNTRVHLPALKAIPDVKIIAVSSRSKEKAEKTAKKYKAKAYTNYGDLLNDEKVDAVFIGLPTFLHEKPVIMAAQTGKHIFCEAPLSLTLEEADRMINAVRKAGVFLMPGLCLRFTPNYAKAKELIDQGLIDEPVIAFYQEVLAIKNLIRQYPSESWIWNKEKTGGLVTMFSPFAIDLLCYLLNSEVTRVYATINYLPMKKFGGLEGFNGAINLSFSNGAMALIEYSCLARLAMETNRVEIIGKNHNSLRALGNNQLIFYDEEPNIHQWIFYERGTKVWGHYQQDEYFIRCILEDKEPTVTAEDARKSQEVALAIAKSSETERTIRL